MQSRIQELKELYERGKITRREFIRNAGLLGLSMSAISTLLAACAPRPAPEEIPATPAPTTPPPTPTPTTPPPSPTPEKEEWVVAITEEAPTLDQYLTSTYGERMIDLHIVEALIDNQGPEFDVVAMLAESWESDPEGKLWTVHLRKGVKFTNGEPLDAEAVKFTLELHSQPESKRYYYIGPVMEKVEIVDPNTVRIFLNKPVPEDLFISSLSSLCIFPPKYVEEVGHEEFGERPIGTGPYRLVERERDVHTTLERNEEYWGAKPFPRRLVLRPITEATTRVAELLAGGADIIMGVPLEQLHDIEAREDLVVLPVLGARQMVFPFYQTKKPFDDVRVRLALNLAIDRHAICEEILEGYGVPMRGPDFAPGTIGYNPDVPEYPYDPERAQELLTEAGYPDGFKADWWVSSGAFVKDLEIVEAVAGQLAEIGVKLNLIVAERPKLVAGFMVGDFPEMTSTTWGRRNDPDIWVSWNMIDRPSFVDQHAIDLLMKSKVTIDPHERDLVFQELFMYLHENPVWLYVVSLPDFYAARKETGWKPYPIFGDLAYNYFSIWLEE